MGKRKGKNRNTGIRSWGVLGALWLVLFCLVGCKVSGSGGGSGIEGNRAVQASSLETEISEAENRGIGNGITEAGTIDAAKPETGKLETEGPAAQQTETENGNTEPEETKAENAEAVEPEYEPIKAGETADGMQKPTAVRKRTKLSKQRRKASRLKKTVSTLQRMRWRRIFTYTEDFPKTTLPRKKQRKRAGTAGKGISGRWLRG